MTVSPKVDAGDGSVAFEERRPSDPSVATRDAMFRPAEAGVDGSCAMCTRLRCFKVLQDDEEKRRLGRAPVQQVFEERRMDDLL